MIKAIIFDIGGVVINDDFLSYAERFTKKTGMTKEQIYRSVIGSSEWRLYFKGKITGEEVWKAIKSKYLPPDIAEDIRKTWKDILVPIPATIELIKKLKPRYKICFISNVDKDTALHVRKKYPEIFRLFNGEVFSYKTGMAKPEKEIYEHALKEFRLKPEECIFIDNQPENIAPAKELGINAIRFRGIGKLKEALRTMGIKF
ncbi:MAG: HAD family phosphatase [Candidatus Aenigmarchaeota archaeon]|nr:HAD family phosphatase [Candidatus Aenigmarchaeota archaeon]